MKNFLDLLATELRLTVCVNDSIQLRSLHDAMVFDVNDTVTIDGIKILPQYRYLTNNQQLTISEPFYRWYHRVSDQGWLLYPQ
jgi:hypothetical protein